MLNFFLPLLYLMVQYSNAQDFDKIELKDTYPWCIVAYDSLKRSPAERIQMIKELGFNKYAYDWRDSHLNDTYTELKLATESNIEVISVWVWLNAKRDSLYRLSASNEQIFATVEQMKLKTTFWVSFSENFFKDLNQEQSIKKAVEMVDYIATKAGKIGCQVALYN
ncbi:MAG: hypothetical protein KJO53_04380, partial [Eudoraea sp.]|nr:hypothetical protein [Eudoraea sp.]